MQQWRDEVAAGRALGPLAQAESDSQNRFREGSVGWVELAKLPEAVREAVEELAIGEISAVLEHGGGLAFYRIDEIRARIEPAAEEVRFKLRQNLFRQRRAELGEALNRSLADAVTVDPGGDPVVQVGDYRLPQSAVDALAALRIPDRAPESLNRAQRLRLVREWAQRVALADEAERRGLHLKPEVAAALRWVLPNVLAADELRYRVDARLVEPAESDLRALFESQGARLREPEHLRVALIQFSDQRDPSREQLAQARRVVGGIQSGELDFEQAAREHSLHPTAAGGGLLPWATRSELGGVDVRLLAPLRMLEPGDDTGLIRSDAGLWFARLVDRRPSRPLSFEEARERLVAIDRRQQIQRFEREIQDEQRARIRLAPAASLPSADERS
jgi:parvulin-like peptidyl-prolyl isomerase